MRAVMFDRYGDPDVLHVAEAPVPSSASGELLVRVSATSVNAGEVIGRQGRLRLVTGRKFPKRIGIDFVGDVVDAGPGVSETLSGQRVWGALDERGGLGAAADYITVQAENVALAPANLSPVEAVTLLAGGSTALRGLRDEAHLRPGDRLLVRGASGGVGSVAVQIGKMLNAHVTGLASASSAEFVRQLGADEVINYHTPAKSLGRYDVIFDTRGTDLRAFRSRLTPHGRMVTIAFDINAIPRSIGYIVWSAVHRAQRVRLFFGQPDRSIFVELTEAAERGDVRPVLDTSYPLNQIAAAHARLEAGNVKGKLVIDLAEDQKQ